LTTRISAGDVIGDTPDVAAERFRLTKPVKRLRAGEANENLLTGVLGKRPGSAKPTVGHSKDEWPNLTV
jgi:hypothetical protein